jgi:hypothetical protein
MTDVLTRKGKPGVAAYICKPSYSEGRSRRMVNLGNLGRLCLKTLKGLEM